MENQQKPPQPQVNPGQAQVPPPPINAGPPGPNGNVPNQMMPNQGQPQNPNQAQYNQSGNPQAQGQPQGQYVPSHVPQGATGSGGRNHAIGGIVCAVLSLLILPPVFGAVGILLGSAAKKRGEENLGKLAIILSAIFMVVGMIFGAWVYMNEEKSMDNMEVTPGEELLERLDVEEEGLEEVLEEIPTGGFMGVFLK